jgi:hypothetical protein
VSAALPEGVVKAISAYTSAVGAWAVGTGIEIAARLDQTHSALESRISEAIEAARVEERTALVAAIGAIEECDGPIPAEIAAHDKETLVRIAIRGTKNEMLASIRSRR